MTPGCLVAIGDDGVGLKDAAQRVGLVAFRSRFMIGSAIEAIEDREKEPYLAR